MGKKIVVLDDDKMMLQIAKRILEKAGYEVVTTDNSFGFTNLVKKIKPDLIFLDIKLPALSGDKMVPLLQKQLNYRPRIVLFSNKSKDELNILKEETGADDYLQKGDGEDSILKMAEKYLGK
ncbi:MAG: response regulator [Deltaproteobacteria bacterium]|nr:MAG: response regulator [Deltaproteobacteria bacterium]